MTMIDESLKNYIEANILPLYNDFDAAHQRDHVEYDEGGYLKLWFDNSPNVARLNALRKIIKNESLLREKFDYLYDTLANPHLIGCTCQQCQPTKYRKMI